MKTILFLIVSFFSTVTLASGWCDSKRTQLETMQCYENLSQNEVSRLGRLYGQLKNHPGMTPEALQQIAFDHDNWAGMLQASCQDPRCTYIALVNRNNALTTRLNALGGAPAAVPVQQAAPSYSKSEAYLRRRCGQGSTAAMNRVCDNPVLWRMEVELEESYEEAVNTIPDNGWIKNDQFEWMLKVRDVCQDDTCLQKVYEERIDELFWIKKHSGS